MATMTIDGAARAARTGADGDFAGAVDVVRLRGSQVEMGAQHGRIVRQLGGFERAVAFYPSMPGHLLREAAGGGPLARALVALGTPALEALLLRMERRRPQDLLARSRAFFEALGLGGRMTRYLMIMDLFQNLVGIAGRLGLGPFARRAAGAAPPACSSLAVWGRASRGGALRYARNFDFPGVGIWDRGPTVVLCAPDRGLRYGFVTTRGADVPGVTAFNEAGLVLAAHTRLHRRVCFDGAAIIDLGHEIARRAETIADAASIARERRVASSWGIAVASGRERRAVTIETTAAGVHVVEPAPGEDFLVTTNHYRHPAARLDEAVPGAAFLAHTHGRFACLAGAARAGEAAGGLGAGELEALLGSHADPEIPGLERAAGGVPTQPYTVQAVVAEPEAGAIHVSAGACPAGEGPYATIAWDWSGEVGAEAVAASPAPGRAPRAASRFSEGDAAAAYASYVEAARLSCCGAPAEEVGAALERAVALDPDETIYRLLAGGLRLKALDARGALAHFERGLRLERSEFRRGQMLLSAARAAHLAGERERAAAFRRELLATRDPNLAEYRDAARDEMRRPLPAARLRGTKVSLPLVDVSC